MWVFYECDELWGEVFAFYKDACCHRLFVYGVVNCRDVAFHKNNLKMVGLHFIRVSCLVRTFTKQIHVVHAFHKPYSFMKCPGSHPPGIRRGIQSLSSAFRKRCHRPLEMCARRRPVFNTLKRRCWSLDQVDDPWKLMVGRCHLISF